MEIDSDTAEVKCPSCGDHWPIRSSSYYCSCGYIFSADEVSDEVNAIIYNAKLIANELRRTMDTRSRISAITDKVIADVAADTIKKGFGERVWNLLKKSIPAIIQAVKGWIGL